MQEIRAVENGYIIKGPYGRESIYTSLDEVFRTLLLYFESRCENFGGNLYGAVHVERRCDEKG